ncbi:stress-induced-phosphoprotein [Aureococcus anophagefferens]|uniref:Stress-induced-phosphoprotein n=1 Tax=Aureococcus anophagefferens TaxID=44056 RepID=A0ABR1FV24_AURAN
MATMKEVIAAKGATVRDGVELDSASAGWSAPFGAVVEVLEEASTASGVARCRVGHGGRAGWVSAKVLRAPTASGESTAARLKAAADELNRAERWPEAVDMYGAAIAADPNNHALYSNRARCRLQLCGACAPAADVAAGLADGERCVALAPGFARGYRRLGVPALAAVAALRARGPRRTSTPRTRTATTTPTAASTSPTSAPRGGRRRRRAVERHRRALGGPARPGHDAPASSTAVCVKTPRRSQARAGPGLRGAAGLAPGARDAGRPPVGSLAPEDAALADDAAKAAHKARGAELFAAANNRSACHAKLDAFAAALRDADACVALKPTWAKAASRRGAALFGLGRYEAAMSRAARPRGDGRRDAGDGRGPRGAPGEIPVESQEIRDLRFASKIEGKATATRAKNMHSNKLILVALAATVTVTESACTNDKKWMINNKRSKNCDWVAKKPSSLPEEGQEWQGQQSRGERGLPRCVTAGMCANEFDLHEPAPTFFERVATFPVCSQIDGACDDETETSAEIVDVHVKACVASWSSAIDGAACAAGVDACPAAPCDGDALGSWCCADADCSGDWFYCNPKAGGQLTAVYTDSPRGVIGWVDLNDPRDPKPLGTFATPGEPTSVAVVGDAAVVAVSTGEDYVATSGALLGVPIRATRGSADDAVAGVVSLPLGGQPDAVAAGAFAGDTAYIAVAIENERDEDLGDGNPPQFPAGHVEIFTAKTANSELGVRLSKHADVAMTGLAGCDFPEDPEPEFVSVSPGNKAVVTMQENNCVAVVDLPTGAVDFSASAGARDLTDVDVAEEGVIDQTASLAAVTAEPDGVVWIKGGAYFATANEGDMAGGSRSWSVFDGATGALVYDSGNFLEHLAASLGHYPEHRSENKGVEPENIAYGEFPDGAGGTRDFVFVNLERSSLVVVYDVTAFPTITYVQTLPAAMGPEGTVAVPAAGIVVTASEEDARDDKFRGALNVYELGTGGAPSFPTLVSQLPADGSAPIPFAALSSLTAEAGDLVLAVEDSAYGKSRVFEIDVGVAPAVVVGGARILDSKDVLRSWSHFTNFTTTVDGAVADGEFDAADLAALVNDDKTVNIDPEGVAVGILGGAVKYVVAHEGYGTVGDAGRPVRSLNFLFVLGLSGPDYVIDEVIALPDAQNARQLRFGFEGVAVLDNKIVVAFQRAWGADEFPQMGVYDYAVGGDAGWSFVFYPVDEPSSQYGGWVSSDMAKQGCWERHIVTRIVSYLNTRDRGLFLDVGANVGAFTATVAANDNDVIAVEPFRLNVRPRVRGDRAPRPPRPSQVPLIRRTMCGPARLDDRVSLYKMGLADSFPGPKMCIWSTNDEINRGNARMTPYFEGRRDFGQDKQKACMEVVYTDTLDHLLFDTHGLARRVDVMKIDIEGFETRALRGAARLLASDFKPCQIYFEYQHDATVESGVDRHELFERLTRAGYKLNDFMKNEEVGSFTPEQWDGMRGGDLRAVLDDASCGWSSRGPPPPPPPPRVVLNGHRCDRHVDVGDADAAGAVARVGALGFVGVADDWATSVCLFHRVYGLPRRARARWSRRRRATRRTTGPTGPSTRPRGGASPSRWTRRARRRPARQRRCGGGGGLLRRGQALGGARRRGGCGGAGRASGAAAGPVRALRPVEALGLPRARRGAAGVTSGRRRPRSRRPRPAAPRARATIAGGRLFATLPADGALAMAYSRAEWNRLPVFLGVPLKSRGRFPAPPVDFLFLLMDVPGVLDASTSPPVFAEARLRRAPPDRRHWLLPSFDFSGGEGNARRWAVTTACDATDDRLDVAAAEVAVEVEASARRTEPSPATQPARAPVAADGPTGITLRNYGFADHGDVCAKEAFLYLDGISTSNGLKYYGGVWRPVILGER